MTRAEILGTVTTDLNALVSSGELSGWALCGGLALAVWGAPRATLDIDVLADPADGISVVSIAQYLVGKDWTLVEHARHPGDPIPELLRMKCGGVGVDILVAHRNWETAMIQDAVVVPWQGGGVPSVRVEALAAMKLRAGGPQDLVDAMRLEGLPDFDHVLFAKWKKKLRLHKAIF